MIRKCSRKNCVLVAAIMATIAVLGIASVSSAQNLLSNGDFEDSANPWATWRTFAVGGESAFSISNDAESGSNAALISITSITDAVDIGLDIWGSSVPVTAGQQLELSFYAKNVGSTGSVIMYQWMEFNAAFTPFYAHDFYASPTSDGYSKFSQTVTVDADAAYGYIGFRIFDASSKLTTGSYLIDNVYMGAPVPEPASLAALCIGLSGLIGFAIKRKA